MVEKYDVQAIIKDLKTKEEMNPEKHDGCYELLRETVNAYAKLNDFSALDYKDLNLIYLTTVGTWSHGLDAKKKMVNECNLTPDDKEYLSMRWDEVWEKAGRGEYTNCEVSAKQGRSIGLFGTGFFSFKRKNSEPSSEQVQSFIRMLIDILPMEDDEQMFSRAEDVLNTQIPGMQAAAASMILHCLKPYSFPIINSNIGFSNIFEVIGVELTRKGSLDTYIDNCRKIKDFRDRNFTCRNYRVFDMEAQKMGEFAITDPSKKRVWLLVWNKNNWNWEGYSDKCVSTQNGGTITESWTCKNTNPKRGDEVFLIKLGEQPRCLIGHGFVVKESYESDYFDPEKAAAGKKSHNIDVEFDRLLDYEKDKCVSQDELNDKCGEQYWSPQSSGIEIKPEVLPALYALWGVDTRHTEQYDFASMVSFLSEYSGQHYVAPDKAGDQAEYMTELKTRGQDARQKFIAFGQKIVAHIPSLEYVSCSNWMNQGQTVERYLWIELKNNEWKEYPNSVSLSIEKHDNVYPGEGYYLSVRAETRDVSSKAADYKRQLRLLDCDLLEGMSYRVKHKDQTYHFHGMDTEKVKELSEEGILQKVEIVEAVDNLPEKDVAGTVFDETLNAVKEILPLYEYVMQEEDWWPSLTEYDPGIPAEQYYELFLNESVVKRTWLKALYEMYQMPNHLGTCKQMSDVYGYAPSHYISYLTTAAGNIVEETGCPVLPQEEENSRYWPVLFQGKHPKDKAQGSYCWKMREPVIDAMERIIAEGVFKTEENNQMAQFDHNTILYGPPGTGKTYNSVIYAVAICDGKSFDEVRKKPYKDVLLRYNNLRDAGRIEFTTFHQSYGYEEFIEGIKPKLGVDNETLGYIIEDGVFKAFCNRAKAVKVQTATGAQILDEYLNDPVVEVEQETKPYVFIIDEINRGNISKIFGELITLIEDTKRAGESEVMEAILPYSGEPFSVPKNVCILGTMNTADRSIALMDTALRRRFEFIEMMPDSNVLEDIGAGKITIGDEELNIARMLDIINKRIEFLFDREHTIGHAFFTKLRDNPSIEALASIFEKNVIPLLQEYFYEDYEKIQLVLGDNTKEDEFKFILDRPVKVQDIFNGNPDIDLPERGYVIQHSAFRKLESYKKIGKDI